MKQNTLRIFIIWAIITGGQYIFPALATCGEINLICNATVANNELKKNQLRDIFLGKQKRWADNKEIELVILNKPLVHKKFVQTYLNKNPIQFRLWWRRQVFTGQGMLPRSFKDEKKLMDYISKTRGAVGYVSPNIPLGANIKVLLVTDG